MLIFFKTGVFKGGTMLPRGGGTNVFLCADVPPPYTNALVRPCRYIYIDKKYFYLKLRQNTWDYTFQILLKLNMAELIFCCLLKDWLRGDYLLYERAVKDRIFNIKFLFNSTVKGVFFLMFLSKDFSHKGFSVN